MLQKQNIHYYFANNTTIVCNLRRKVKTIGKEKISHKQIHIHTHIIIYHCTDYTAQLLVWDTLVHSSNTLP